MSAYICDPRTIDYLVTWATHTRDLSIRLRDDETTPFDAVARSGNRLNLRNLTPNDVGQILFDENIRSVSARYDGESLDTLPGPVDKSRVLKYRFSPVAHQLAPWVIKSAQCVEYQSCETSDYYETLAYRVLQAIREAAIRHFTVDAPWGVTQADIDAHTAYIRANMKVV